MGSRRWEDNVLQRYAPWKHRPSFRHPRPTSVVFAITVYNLYQLCPIELSTMTEMVCICAVQYGSH